MQHAQASAATATGDTTKTLIDTITLPSSAKKISGLWCYACGAAIITSGEPISGIVEFESPDVGIQPMQLPLDIVDALTSGAVAFNPRILPCNIPLSSAASRISAYVTMDVAQTGGLKARFGVLTE